MKENGKTQRPIQGRLLYYCIQRPQSDLKTGGSGSGFENVGPKSSTDGGA